MPMPAEFCYPDDAQDEPEPYLSHLGAYVEALQCAQWESTQAAMKALRACRAARGTPDELRSKAALQDAVYMMKHYGRKLAELQS